jgi:simple sugar transport system ATP-binding protein
MPSAAPVIEARGIHKRFGSIEALRGADLEVRAGEVLALVGDNGAGKSTLAKVICGAMAQDAGELFFAGKPVLLQSIRHALDLGVATVYQDLAQAPDLSIPENVYLGRYARASGWLGRLGVIDRRAMHRETNQSLVQLGITLRSLSVPVRQLSGGQRQAVAIVRAVMWARSAILMDEPTAALGTRQTAIVYDTIQAAARRGLAVVVISHDLPRMLKLADRMAIMRHGRVIAVEETRSLTLSRVVGLMLGATEVPA